jgi:hypothetical protein
LLVGQHAVNSFAPLACLARKSAHPAKKFVAALGIVLIETR